MATLAEVLRQAGYVTPQGQVVGPRTDLAQKLKSYVMNIPQNAAQNLANQRADIDAALTMGEKGIQIGDRAAFERQMAEVPNLGGVMKVSGAMRTAQRNAALPVEQGGLGLPPTNTAADRAKALGFDVSGYHGRYKDYSEINPNKTFYVTSNPEYASLYTNPSASSMGGKSAKDFVDLQPNVMPVQIKSKDILDTRTPEGKKLFEEQFYGKYGNATPLTNKGLPDWVDAEDFAEFFKDKKLPYKGVIVDEGSVPLPDGGVQWRGASTAIFDPSLVKSKFAAFDPKKANKPSLLGGALALPLAADEDTRRTLLEKLFNEQQK